MPPFHTIMLTPEQIKALDRAINDLPKRVWDSFIETASPCLNAMNAQLAQPAPASTQVEMPLPPAAPLANGVSEHEPQA